MGVLVVVTQTRVYGRSLTVHLLHIFRALESHVSLARFISHTPATVIYTFINSHIFWNRHNCDLLSFAISTIVVPYIIALGSNL